MNQDHVEHDLTSLAVAALQAAQAAGVQIVTAESCTGGQIASSLTDVPSLSRQFDRGFITYTEEAKTDLLGVPATAIAQHGAVSEQVARLMAGGALAASKAGLALAVTGFAGEAGPHDEAGLVYLATQDERGHVTIRQCNFGNAARRRAKDLASAAGLEMLANAARLAASRPK